MSERPSLGVIMDPIASIHPKKDTTLALLLEAKARGFDLHYLELSDLFLQYGQAFGKTSKLTVFDDPKCWYQLGERTVQPLDNFDVLLMRKDPPVTMEYIYATYILEHAEQNGTLVVNKPQSLRDANEKIFTTWFPHCMPPTLVTSEPTALKEFVLTESLAVLKPLDMMGGKKVFKCEASDPNLNAIIETLTEEGKRFIMAQKYIPAITAGDKRILMIDGDPFPYALTRLPAPGEFRANLATGGEGKGSRLTERDLWICAQTGPLLREKGLMFVGLDVIGEYLTEINVTSPTCVREIEEAFDIDITGKILDCIMEKLQE